MDSEDFVLRADVIVSTRRDPRFAALLERAQQGDSPRGFILPDGVRLSRNSTLRLEEAYREWRLEHRHNPPPPPKLLTYVDGACADGVMGLGIYSEDLDIDLSVRLRQTGTNNVAECLAAIRACVELRRRGLFEATLLCDSQLVVNWVRGSCRMLSGTAQRYIPTLRALLLDRRSTIKWIPGSSNLADKPSRRLLPHSGYSFRDLARMKSGRDQYSAMRIDRLKGLITSEQITTVEEQLELKRYQASAYRWILRGLDTDLAIRKVKVDAEVGLNAIWARSAQD